MTEHTHPRPTRYDPTPDPNEPEDTDMPDTAPPPNGNTRVLSWYERQSPTVRAALVVPVTTPVNQIAPWLAPLVRAAAVTPPAE